MISELYRQLEAAAVSEFGDIVETTELITRLIRPSWMFGILRRASIHSIGNKAWCETASSVMITRHTENGLTWRYFPAIAMMALRTMLSKAIYPLFQLPRCANS